MRPQNLTQHDPIKKDELSRVFINTVPTCGKEFENKMQESLFFGTNSDLKYKDQCVGFSGI